jgi:eukaryotic-like serine/threonine-protein kinase
MMDAASNDPVEMIVKLAGGMMAGRRGRFLDAACGGDEELRAEVEARMGVSPKKNSTVEQPSGVLTDQVLNPESDSIESIALKALSEAPGLNESQPVESKTDVPEDLPIDTYCDQKKLDTLTRLRLFQSVCRAIDQHHRRGLIHSGLTPRHIRVFPDGSLRVILREPGIQPAEDLLKPGYASPEQVLGEPVTMATDVYQLGVLLYELLTGRSPYRFRSQDSDEICNAISEQSPERPSRAVVRPDTLAGSAANIIEARRTSPAKLQQLLAGDLELIVLHALHKEPERRYATAEQFAEDIDHFLQLRPVRAHRESRFYRAGKFIRRHPVATATGLFLAIAMTAGLIGSAFGLSRARRERDHAEASFQIARSAVDELFTRIDEHRQFDALGLQPVRARLLENLLRYYENILDHLGNDPGAHDLAAEAQHRIAQIDHLIGLPDVAVLQLERTIDRYEALIARKPGEAHYRDGLAGILDELGEVLLSIEGRSTEALPFLERARSLLEEELAAGPKVTARRRELARVLGNLAEVERAVNQPDRAQVNLTRAIRILDDLIAANPQKVDDRIALASAQIALGRVLSASPDALDLAAVALNKGIELRETITREHPDRFDQVYELALDLGELAAIERKSAHLESAVQSENQALELFEQLDRRFPDMVSYQRVLYLAYDMAGQLRSQQGEIKLALKLAGQARTVLERLVVQHPRELVFQIDLSRCHGFIGRLLYLSHRFTEALHSFQRAVDLLESLPQLDPANNYQLAVDLALCVSLIGAGPAAAPPDDEAEFSPADRLRRQVYGTRAVSALNRAVAGGFASLETCQSNADLDSLRDRPDFQKLLQEMAEEGKKTP